MTIVIADNSPRISYVATAGQTVFTVPFEFFDDLDVNLYINDVLKVIETDYTVSGGDGSTGTLILVTGAALNDVIVLTRSIELERATDFPTSGPFQVNALNVELDKHIAMIADLQDLANRGLRLSDSDTTLSLTLADKDVRKGTVLAFNATTGAVEVGPTIADTNTVAQIKADISTVAGISGNVTTVAGISSDVTTVAGVSTDVTTVAGQTTNMQNITDNLTDIQNASTNATNAATSASNAASSETAAASSASSAATSEANAGTSATNAATSASSASSSASTATTKASEASTSASNAATSETNAGVHETNSFSNAGSAFSSASSAFSSASSAASSASSASSAQTAAEAARDSALAAFDNFDDKYLGEKASDPTLDNDGDALVAGALYFNTTDDAMKVYNGTSWVESYVDGTSFVAKAGDTMTGDLVVNASIQSGPLTVTAGAFGYNGINILDDGGSTGSSLTHINGGFYLSGDQSLDNIKITPSTFRFQHPTEFVFNNDVEITGDLSFGSGDKALFNSGGFGLEVYNDGFNSYFDANIGTALISGTQVKLLSNGGETMFQAQSNGAVTLYHDHSAKLATTATGIDVTGNATFVDNGKAIFGVGSDLQIYHDGSNSYVKDAGDGSLLLQGDSLYLMNAAGSSTYFYGNSGTGAVQLRYGNSAKFDTTATGIDVTGTVTADGATFNGDVSLGDNHAILLGDEPNLSISHNATNSVIADVGGGNITMSTNGNQILFYDSLNSRSMFRTATNGRLELFYQGDIKLETKSEGIEVTGSVVSQVDINARGSSYTTVLSDQSKLVTLTSASAITLTIPANSSVAYPVGTKIDLAQLGAGQVTVAGAGGVTVNATPTLKFRDQYSAASCIKTATDTWLLVGDLEA